MAGSTIYSDSKLMYFPTHNDIIYRILGVIGRINRKDEFNYKADEIKEYLGKETYDEITLYSMDHNLTRSSCFYDYFISQHDYSAIKKFFNIAIGYSKSDTITVLDPFAGEGDFLSSFKSYLEHNSYSSNIHLIANELEKNRYNQIIENGIVDEYYNGAYEEFNVLPKNSISLLLYNPPYGNTNGVRNVKHYLEMIIEQNIIHNSDKTGKYDNGIIVMVIRKDDLLDSLPLIVRNFEIYKECLHKVHEEEYDRYKQFVVFAKLRKHSLDGNHTSSALHIQSEVQTLTDLINTEPEFNVKMYDTRINLPTIPYAEMKRNHEIVHTLTENKSELNNVNWKWIREITEMKEMSTEVIEKATPIKSGELANIIASGMINGEVRINGKLNHIVTGGTLSKLREEVEVSSENGEKVTTTKKILYSEPYLNILVKDKDGLKIKELSGGSNLE